MNFNLLPALLGHKLEVFFHLLHHGDNASAVICGVSAGALLHIDVVAPVLFGLYISEWPSLSPVVRMN